MANAAGGRIFLSYRRQETQHPAGRLADRLADRFGPGQIFMDVDTIEPGVDFAAAITRAVSTCVVLIAVIGPKWTTLTNARGQPRIADPDDVVALEIKAALDRGIRVIPVLVDGASMPASDELPEALQGLARRHAIQLDHESFRSDASRLLTVLEKILDTSPEPAPVAAEWQKPSDQASGVPTAQGRATTGRAVERHYPGFGTDIAPSEDPSTTRPPAPRGHPPGPWRRVLMLLPVLLVAALGVLLFLLRDSDCSDLAGSSAATPVVAVAVTPDSGRVVSGSGDGTVKVWDLATCAEQRTLTGHTDVVWAVAVTPDGGRVVSGSQDGTVRVWDLATGAEQRTITGHTDVVWAVAVTPDGRRVVSGSADRTVKVWDLATGAEQRTLTGHTGSVFDVAVTPDGGRMVSGSEDGTVKVWDLATGAEQRTLTGHTHWVKAVAVTPDGGWVVSGSQDGTVKVWDLATGAEQRTLTGHTDVVSAVAVTPDGGRVVSGSDDGTVKVWDLAPGGEQRTLTGHTNWVSSVAVTPDGGRVVSGSHDGTMKVWDLAPGAKPRA